VPIRTKTDRVIISDHAYGRYLHRVGIRIGRGALAELIRSRLRSQLPGGKEVRDGAIEVFLTPEIRAVVVPDVRGYWAVETILGPTEKFFGKCIDF
jgi:hypothetical protein